MAKTDKELTVEIVNTFIASWFSKSSNRSLSGDELTAVIKDVYKTISSLGDSSQDD